MGRRFKLFLILLTFGAIIFGLSGKQTGTTVITVGQAIQSAQQSEPVSVIITAEESSLYAAQAVARAGGQVSSDLWLINAVAATLPAGQLPVLAAQPGIVSIAANKSVKTVQEPVWDGWVTDYRFPVPWDGSPDVQTTHDVKSYPGKRYVRRFARRQDHRFWRDRGRRRQRRVLLG
jgi:hypothetical protein